MEEISSHIFHFSARLITRALENFEYPWDVKGSMFLSLCFLAVVQVVFKIKQLFENTSETRSVATQALASSTAATQIPEGAAAATQIPARGDPAAEPEDQPVPVSVALIEMKQRRQNPARSVEEDAAGPSREQEKEAEPEVFTQSLSLSDLRDIRKDFRRHPGEHVITWLLQCWDTGAGGLELDGREARLLRSLSGEAGIDQAIGNQRQVLSLWSHLRSSVKERYPFKENIVCPSVKWSTVEKGIQYLRELAMLEMIYYDPDNAQLPTNPGEVQCTGEMWHRFVQSASSSYAKLLSELKWEDEEAPTVDDVSHHLRYFFTD